MNWEYELAYPPRRGATRVAWTAGAHGRTYTRYETGTLGDVFRQLDPFYAPVLSYYWEDGRGALLPSAVQWAINKHNAPTE